MTVQLNKPVFESRVQRIYDCWQNAAENTDYSSLVGTDALLLVVGDPTPEGEPTRTGTRFQHWLLGYEFPSTLILFEAQKITILCSASKAKILSQIEGSSGRSVPVEILATSRNKEPEYDALHHFFALYASKKRVGTLKEVHRGKLIDEWKKLHAPEKPALLEMSSALSALMSSE
ncbi:FACT complex subunit Spt16, N-terminal lobe domain-containing protein [Mycena latifolia]|nr:FACT complex subunit Spt16, N-terminal lobe domain-containing protein [Mycena latifolia]